MNAHVFATEVGRAYLKVADLSEATISPEHAVDIAEWAVGLRRLRRRRAAWQAQALREYLARWECVTPSSRGDA